jgi:hypothetical protein
MFRSSKNLVARSLRTISILGGVFVVTSLANVASADTNSATDAVLNKAVSQIQDMMASMSKGCPGGPGGEPTVNWTTLQLRGNSAVNALNASKVAMAKGEPSHAVQHINSAEAELDALVNGAHDNCSGGAHGVDPLYYARYQSIRDSVKATLDVLKLFLS